MSKLNIPACCLNGTIHFKADIKNKILNNEYRLVYTTPEYIIKAEEFVKELEEKNLLILVAIDESHCISAWGNDFRSSYRQLNRLKEWTKNTPVLALTATATSIVQKDIINLLNLKNPLMVRTSFDRSNLYIKVCPKSDIVIDLVPLLNNNKPAIVYCQTRKETEKIRDILKEHGIKCEAYHAGLHNIIREATHKSFIKNEIHTLVCTVAYGLGIDHIVRKVIHYGLPKDMESYYQEMGRAGRDGKRSKCYLFYALKDIGLNNFLINKIEDPKYRNHKLGLMAVMKKYMYTHKCRRKIILKYFGEEYPKDNCNNCDNCKGKNRSVRHDLTKESLLLLQTISYTGNMYGMTMLVNILRGSNSKKIPARFKRLKVYGVGKYKPVVWWKTFGKILESVDYIREVPIEGSYGSSIQWTLKGKKWLQKVVGPTMIEPKHNCQDKLIMRLPKGVL